MLYRPKSGDHSKCDWKRGGGVRTNLLIFVGEESLKYFTAGNNRMPAHPGHPALQPLHSHFNKLFLKTPWKREQAICQHYLSCFVLQLAVTESAVYLSPACLVKRGWGWLTRICPAASHTANQSACICD